MSPLQAARGMIVRDSKTGRRYEVLGLGRRPGTLRLLDLEKREVWYNASAQWYEPTGQRIEDVPLPVPDGEICTGDGEANCVCRDEPDTDDGSMDLYNSRFGDD